MNGVMDILPLPFDSEDMDPEVLFSSLSDGTGNPPFGVLCGFMQTLLCLPDSNVDVERLFSDVSAIKSKKRNHLQLNTLCAILKVKQAVRESGGCTKFSPPSGARKLMLSRTLYKLSESDTD